MRRISISSLNCWAGSVSEVLSPGITPHPHPGLPLPHTALLRPILWVLLPSGKHGDEIVPAMQDHHHQMSENKRQHRPHDQEMPDARQMEPAQYPRQPGKLHRLPDCEACQHRKLSQPNRRGVRMLLERVIGFSYGRLGTEEEVVAHHRPYSREVPTYKEHLLIVSAEDLVTNVHKASRNIDPHEGKVPLQRTSQPTAQRKGFGPIEQVFLRDLCPEARECAKDLESAAHHHKKRDCVHPMAKAYHKRVFIDGLGNVAGLRVFDCDRAGCHC